MSTCRYVAVDWFRLVWDLVQRGQTIAAIERRTGISSSTIRLYQDGSQPPAWRAVLLWRMWCETMGRRDLLEALDTLMDGLPMTELVIAPRVVNAQPQVQASVDAMHDLERAWRQA